MAGDKDGGSPPHEKRGSNTGMDTVIARHIAHLQGRNLSEGTIYQRQRALHRLRTVHPDLLEVSTDELRVYFTRWSNPGTRRGEIMHIAGFFDWALREEIIERNPTLRVERPKVHRRLPRPMSDVDKDRALAAAPAYRIRPMLYLAAYAGLRACAIAPLRAEDLGWDDQMIWVERDKGGAPRAKPMSGPLRNALLTCDLPDHGWLFPKTNDPASHLMPWSVSSVCNTYLHDLGIDSTLHTLRHWFGTKTLRKSGNLRVTQEALGHASIASTAIYTEVLATEVASAIEDLDLVG